MGKFDRMGTFDQVVDRLPLPHLRALLDLITGVVIPERMGSPEQVDKVKTRIATLEAAEQEEA